MDTHIPISDPGETTPETRRFLTAADYFLQRRSFADCCKYAARARDSDPTHPSPTCILSTASILSVAKISPTLHDYYSLLNLPYFESNVSRIGHNFEALSSILDPNATPCPFSSEAFDLVVKAWSVLSNPVEKAKYDDELRRKMPGGCTSSSSDGTFWTICPYCYYVYEYDKVYEDCSLRCANERCRRVLHAVAIAAPPPPDAIEKGEYLCPGFMPFAVSNSNGEAKLWSPFEPPRGEGCNGNVGRDRDCVVIASSDDDAEVNQNNGNGKYTRIEEEEGSNHGHSNGTTVKRRKSVPLNPNKLNIIGNVGEEVHTDGRMKRGKWNSNGGGEMHADQIESLFGGDEVEIGMEFLEGDDDVLISLPYDVDLEKGEL